MAKRNPFLPKATKDNRQFTEGQKSKGILDDFSQRESTDLATGKIQHIPSKEKDLVNKEYVDSLIRGNVELFLTEDASDIGTYLDLTVDSTGNPEENTTQAITGNSTTLIASYASILNEAEIEAITDLEPGIYSAHIHASANFPAGMTIYFEFYRRTSLGAETLLGTSHDSNTLGAIESQEELHANVSGDLMWNTGDRIVVKVYGRNGNSPSKDITIYIEGDTLSRVLFPAFIPPTFVGPHDMASHTDDDTYNINTSGTATIGGIIYADGNVGGLGLDVLRSANISINLGVGQDLDVVRNIIVGGTIINTDFTTLTDTSNADSLHDHSTASIDDYEEGTYQATVVCSTSGNYVLSANDDLAYVKIGNLVHVQGRLSITSANSPSGNLRVSLPFTVGSSVGLSDLTYGVGAISSHGGSMPNNCFSRCSPTTAYFEMISVPDNGVSFFITNTNVDTRFEIMVNVQYMV